MLFLRVATLDLETSLPQAIALGGDFYCKKCLHWKIIKKNIGKIFTPNDNISWLDSLLFISLSMQRNIWDGWTIKSIGQWPYNNNMFIHFVHILKKKLMQRKVRDGGTLQPWDGWTISSNTGVWSWLQLLPTGETILLNHRNVFFTTLNYNYKQTKKYFLLSVIFMNFILFFL